MRNSGQVLTRTMIFEAVWGYSFNPGTNLIDVHVAQSADHEDGRLHARRLERFGDRQPIQRREHAVQRDGVVPTSAREP